MTALQALAQLQEAASPQKAKILQRFFKTGPGAYGQGDVFLGIVVPETRKIARRFVGLPLFEIRKLLNSPLHEARLLALIILVQRFLNADTCEQKSIYEFYLRSTGRINNWDLVDVSAPAIVGGYLAPRSKVTLGTLARSTDLWERRIAIVATFYFIREGKFSETLRIAKILLADSEDLIHKAVGWMLREVGKRDQALLEKFLKQHYPRMPRTALRYAIERFSQQRRQQYLRGTIEHV